ncbi:hypothetical protein E2C01_056834 [Portunus trituberculatus]|nr:hypothetical protein [Portunus trituberculatus]
MKTIKDRKRCNILVVREVEDSQSGGELMRLKAFDSTLSNKTV